MLKLLGWLLPVLLSVWLVVLQQCSNSVCFGFFALAQLCPALLGLMKIHALVVAAVGKKGGP